MSVVFVRPHHEYHSYVDYWRLVELSGYPVCFDDDMELERPDHTYILTWFSAQGANWQNARARLIVWNLEWAMFDHIPAGVSEVWTPDAWYAEQSGYRYVPVGSHGGLREGVRYPAEYDIALMMYRDPHRRRQIINRLERTGLKIAPDGWGKDRARSLNGSRMMVNIHQLDHLPALAPLRMALAAAYGLPVITESAGNVGILDNAILETTYRELPALVLAWSKYPLRKLLDIYGEGIYSRLCEEYTFRRCVEAAL